MPSTPRSRKLLDPHTRRKLVAELQAGPTRREALDRLHISESTFYRELERSAELRALLNQNGDGKGYAHRNGNGPSSHAKGNGEGHKGRGRRQKRTETEDQQAAAEGQRVTAANQPQETSARSDSLLAESIAKPEQEAPARLRGPVGKASKPQKGPKGAKLANQARPKSEVGTSAITTAGAATKRSLRRSPDRAEAARAAPAASASKEVQPGARTDAAEPSKSRSRQRSAAATPVAAVTVRRPRGSARKASVQEVPLSQLSKPRPSAARARPTASRRRQPASSQQAYWLPPVLVLASEIVVGIVVGASPIILLLVTGSMVAVLYAVRRWGLTPPPPRQRPAQSTASRVETRWPAPATTTSRAAPIVAPVPAPEPIAPATTDGSPEIAPSARRTGVIFRARDTRTSSMEQPAEPIVEAPHNDLRWLWNSIGRDPRPPRPPRRDGR